MYVCVMKLHRHNDNRSPRTDNDAKSAGPNKPP